MYVRLILVFTFISSLFLSCKKEQPKPLEQSYLVEYKVVAKCDNQPIDVNKKYVLPSGDSIQFSDLSFYFTNCYDDTTLISDAALFRLSNPSKTFISYTTKQFPTMNFSALLGVDSTVNQSDPTTFPNNHPLNILQANDLHWGWNPGYVFVKIEAKVDTLNSGGSSGPKMNVSYHLGKNSNLRPIVFPAMQYNREKLNENTDKITVTFTVDLFTFFKGDPLAPINLREKPTCHSEPGEEVLTQQLLENFRKSFQGVQ